MDNKQQKSQLRKKLENSSRKTRRSTDLRRSLGRKSIGDLNTSDLTALEQPSISPSDESCHLNSDSNVIDPGFTDNPEWFNKSVVRGVLATETSINAAFQQERVANIPNTSDVLEHDFSSFNPRDVNKILCSSVIVEKEELQAMSRRGLRQRSIGSDDSASNLSLEFPKRKPSAFRRGKKGNAIEVQGTHNVFAEVLENTIDQEEKEESIGATSVATNKSRLPPNSSRKCKNPHSDASLDDSLKPPVRKRTKFQRGIVEVHPKSQGRQTSFDRVLNETSNDSIEENPLQSHEKILLQQNESLQIDNSLELPHRKPARFKRGAGLQSKKTASGPNVFSDLLEESSITGEGNEEDPHQSQEKILLQGNESLQIDNSLELPHRKPARFKRGAGLQSKKTASGPNVFSDLLEESSITGEGNEEDPHQSQEKILLQGNESLQIDNSLELPHRKPARFKRGAGLQSKKSASGPNVFSDLLEESSITEEGMSLLNHVENNEPAHRTGESDNLNPKTQVKTAIMADDSIEIPKRRPTAFTRGEKHQVEKSDFEKNPFLEVLENTATSESHVELTDSNVKQPAKANLSSNRRKSLDELNDDVNDDVNSNRKKRSYIHLPSAAAKENVLPSPSQNSAAAYIDSLNNTYESLPIGAEAGNFSEATQKPRLKKFRWGPSATNRSASDQTARLSEPFGKRDETDHIREAPPGISNTPNVHEEQSSSRNRNFSHVLKDDPKHTNSFISYKEPDVLKGASPKSAVLHSRKNSDGSSAKVESSTLSNETRNSSNGNHLSIDHEEQVSKFPQGPSGDADSDNDIPDNSSANSSNEDDPNGSDGDISSNAGSNVAEDDVSDINDHASSISICSVETVRAPPSTIASITTPGSLESKFRSANADITDPVPSSAQTSTGTDSVFKSVGTGSIPNNASQATEKIVGLQNESWPEDPFVDVLHVTGVGRGTSESRTNTLSDVAPDEGVPSVASVKGGDPSSLASIQTHDIPQLESNMSLKSSTAASGSGSNARSLVPQPQKVITPLVWTEEAKSKMRAGLSKWFQHLKDNKTVIEGALLPASKKPSPVKKPEPAAPKRPPRKKTVCPYFGDYKPPRRVKPKPYVTSGMYKFLETKLQLKFGIESRIKAEEFVIELCKCVTQVMRRRSKYETLVINLRDHMYSLGLIKTQFDFHIFIEDYLPDAFREKSIPCYGSTKAPPFDALNLHKDLSKVI